MPKHDYLTADQQYWHAVNCRSHVGLALDAAQKRINRRMRKYHDGELHNNLLRQAVMLRINIKAATYSHDCGPERFLDGGRFAPTS